MSLPLIAIVGRPNVGKSTLVNRISKEQFAIVDKEPGITRDRNYVETDWSGRTFTLIDTGGIDFGTGLNLTVGVREQAMVAIDEANVILLVVDGTTGPLASDFEIAEVLRQTDKPVLLLVNKIDSPKHENLKYAFYELNLGEPLAISALHGLGIGEILDKVIDLLPPEIGERKEGEELGVAIVGRPNVGKSSLFNLLAGQERAIVSNIPGTTRDAVDTVITQQGQNYRFIDTAGFRKRAKIDLPVEYYGIVRTLRALDRAHIALILLDTTEAATEQDQKIADYAKNRGCGTVILINKWDLIAKEIDKESYLKRVREKLRFIDYSPILTISAKTGFKIKRIYPLIDEIASYYFKQISTSELNRFISETAKQGHALTKGKRKLRVFYATQTSVAPPKFLFFCNYPELAGVSYKRYWGNRIRDTYNFKGCPIIISFRKK